MKRRTAREKALQALFSIDMSKVDVSTAMELVLEGKKEDEFLNELVNGVVNHQEEIDAKISPLLEKWTLERLSYVDRNILRIATYELIFGSKDIPVNVILDEAIEVAKVFGDDNSSKFVNGLLSKLKNQL